MTINHQTLLMFILFVITLLYLSLILSGLDCRLSGGQLITSPHGSICQALK